MTGRIGQLSVSLLAPAPTPASRINPGVAGSTQTLPQAPKAPALASEKVGKAASLAFLISGVMGVLKGPGVPSWQSAYLTAQSINSWTDDKFLPSWLASGPVNTSLELAVVGSFTLKAAAGLPEEIAHLQKYIAAAKAASAGATGAAAGVKALWKGLLHNETPVADAAKAAKDIAPPSFVDGLFKYIAPIYKLGVTLSGAASFLGLFEYLDKHGTSGLLDTTTGRDAIIGAASGAMMVASTWLPPSPLGAFCDMASDVLWLAQIVNGNGWLDAVLGGDPQPAAN